MGAQQGDFPGRFQDFPPGVATAACHCDIAELLRHVGDQHPHGLLVIHNQNGFAMPGGRQRGAFAKCGRGYGRRQDKRAGSLSQPSKAPASHVARQRGLIPGHLPICNKLAANISHPPHLASICFNG
jgi:hypothetical protein